MPSITPMISDILRALTSISPMRAITSRMARAPRVATALDWLTTWRAGNVLCALLRVASDTCCIALPVCCSAAARLSVRTDRSVLPLAISLDAWLTPSAVWRTSSPRLRGFLHRVLSSQRSQKIASLPGELTLVTRSPPAMRITQSTALSTDALLRDRVSPAHSPARAMPATVSAATASKPAVAALANSAAHRSSARAAAAPSVPTVPTVPMTVAISKKPSTTGLTRLN